MAFTTPQTGAQQIRYDAFAGPAKRGYFVERVTVAGNMPFAALSTKFPPRSRVIWSAIKNVDAVTPRLASSAAATAGNAAIALVWTAPTSLATGSVTSNIGLSVAQTAFGAAIPAASVGRGVPGVSTAIAKGDGGGQTPQVFQNTSTSEQTFYLVPFLQGTATAAEATQSYKVSGTTAATTQNSISGTGTSTVSFDVHVQIETYQDTPTA